MYFLSRVNSFVQYWNPTAALLVFTVALSGMASRPFRLACALFEFSDKAHARRDYADALKALKDEDKKYASGTIAHKAPGQIAAIYKAAEAYKDKTTQERYNGRQEKVKPLVEAYFAWVREQEPATILSEKTRDGLKYSLNQEEYLKVFLEDGRIPIDNSATERAIRPFTVGRATGISLIPSRSPKPVRWFTAWWKPPRRTS